MKQHSILQKLTSLVEQDENPMNFKEACQYLDISSSYLYKLTSKNLIPFWKPMGKKIYFLKSDLRNHLLRNRHSTEQELEKKAADFVTFKSEVLK